MSFLNFLFKKKNDDVPQELIEALESAAMRGQEFMCFSFIRRFFDDEERAREFAAEASKNLDIIIR